MAGLDEWEYAATQHRCLTCDSQLLRVIPSTMLVCSDKTCDADPLFLIVSEDDVR